MRFVSVPCSQTDHNDLALCNPHLLLIQLRHACAIITLHWTSQRNANRFSTSAISIIDLEIGVSVGLIIRPLCDTVYSWSHCTDNLINLQLPSTSFLCLNEQL